MHTMSNVRRQLEVNVFTSIASMPDMGEDDMVMLEVIATAATTSATVAERKNERTKVESMLREGAAKPIRKRKTSSC